tara:strand:+ start:13772 stop:15160 length:1389 start_codon:yes stop_codon:yes gene_type:complete
MSKTIQGSRNYTGQDNETVLFEGLDEGDNDLFTGGFRVIITNETTLTLNWWKAIIKQIRAYAGGFDGGKNSKRTHKVLSLTQVKRESEFDEEQYYGTVFYRARQDAKGGARNNQMTKGQLLAAELKLLNDSVKHDVYMLGFCGHTNKPHVDSATGVAEFNDSDASYDDENEKVSGTSGQDIRYNMINGFWAELFDNVKDVTIASKFKVSSTAIVTGSTNNTHTLTLTGSNAVTVDINGRTYTETYASDVTTTCANFVATHGPALAKFALHGMNVTSAAGVITFASNFKGAKIVLSNAGTGNALAETVAYNAGVSLTTDQAYGTMIDMVDEAPRQVTNLITRGKAVFLVTEDMYKNLQKTFRTIGDLESMTKRVIDGVDVTMLEGVVVRIQNIQQYIEDDFGGVNKHRAILTTPDNLVIAANATAGKSRVWYNEDENTNRTRTQFWMGADFVSHNLIHVAAEF